MSDTIESTPETQAEDLMRPDSSPSEQTKSGVRKVNNLPIFILAGAIGLFLLMMMIVAADRAEQQNKPINEDQQTQTVSSAISFANDIVGANAEGIVPAEGSGEIIDHSGHGGNPPTGLQPQLVEEAKPEFYLANGPAASHYQPQESRLFRQEKTSNGFSEDDFVRLKMARMQLLEQAVKSKTSVSGFGSNALGGSSSFSGFSGSPRDQLSAVRHKISQLDKYQGQNPNQAYKDKLEQLKGIMASVGGASSTAGLGSGLSGGNSSPSAQQYMAKDWRLHSKMDTPETPYILRAGFVIPGIMISGINSDLPGQIMAQVAQDVYDTPVGKHLLIPQGSRLVGTYSAQVAYGQSRVLVAWNRIVFPDGKALDIAGMQGADSAGYAGYKDRVNTHFWRVIGSSFLLSGIAAGVSLTQDRADQNAGNNQRASDALSEALGQQLGQAMTQMIMKNLNISPTIEVRPGYRFNVMVSKDMVFNKPYQSFDY